MIFDHESNQTIFTIGSFHESNLHWIDLQSRTTLTHTNKNINSNNQKKERKTEVRIALPHAEDTKKYYQLK